MVDSVLDWDSIWERVTENIDTDEVESKEDFQQKMITDFFKGKYNPKRAEGKSKLIDELWDHGISVNGFPKVIEIAEEDSEEIEKDVIEATTDSLMDYIEKNTDLTDEEKAGFEKDTKETLEDIRKDVLKDVTKDIMGERDKELSQSQRRAMIREISASIMKDIEADLKAQMQETINERIAEQVEEARKAAEAAARETGSREVFITVGVSPRAEAGRITRGENLIVTDRTVREYRESATSFAFRQSQE